MLARFRRRPKAMGSARSLKSLLSHRPKALHSARPEDRAPEATSNALPATPPAL